MRTLTNKSVFKQTLLSLCISMSYFVIGLVRGYSSTALPSIKELNPELAANVGIESWIGATAPLGAFIGSLAAAPVMHYVGRKMTILISSPLSTTAWLYIGFATDWKSIIFCRFINGFSVGLCIPSAQIYVTECCSAEIRGIVGSLPAIFMSIGILVSYIIGSFLSWFTLAWVSAGFALSVAITVCFLPESPVWLKSKNKPEKANLAMEWLHLPKSPATTSDSGSVEKSINKKNNIFQKSILKPLSIGLMLLIIQQVSGVDAIIFFTVHIFKTSGSSIDGHLSAIIVGAVQVIANIFSLFIIDKFGRKPLLISSGILTSVSTTTMGIAFYLNDRGNHDFGFLPLVSLIVFMIGFSIGFGCIPFLLMGELFPAKYRGLFSSIAGSFNLGVMFIVLKTYHPLERFISTAGTFWIYSIFCALGVIFVIFCVPETKGRSLDSIEMLFNKKNKKCSKDIEQNDNKKLDDPDHIRISNLQHPEVIITKL